MFPANSYYTQERGMHTLTDLPALRSVAPSTNCAMQRNSSSSSLLIPYTLITRTTQIFCTRPVMSAGRGSNACMILNSYHQGCSYEFVSEAGPPHSKEYVFGVTILGAQYLGRGKSKKEAKQAAAANALNTLYHLRLSLGTGAAGT